MGSGRQGGGRALELDAASVTAMGVEEEEGEEGRNEIETVNEKRRMKHCMNVESRENKAKMD